MNTTLGSLQLSSELQIALYLINTQPHWGKITKTASLFSVCRDKVYQALDWAKEAIHSAFHEKGIRQNGEEPIVLCKQDIERSMISLRLHAKSSLRGIEAFFQESFGIHVSHGWVHEHLHQAAEKARAMEALVSYEDITHMASDEIFLKKAPVLTGICLKTGFIIFLRAQQDRKGDTWGKLLSEMKEKRDLNPVAIVKDTGSGMTSAVKEVFKEAHQHADIFHLYYKFHPHRKRLEKDAYRQIQKEEDLIQNILKTSQSIGSLLKKLSSGSLPVSRPNAEVPLCLPDLRTLLFQ